ncbi:DUF3152 domain-containing protein [Streptomyces morookaense]|uniref:DUF3152 domain-containing protein n=1 Tax=Streptomyces morookaense TaxID=1970 RepID=UPI003408EE51
MGRHSARADRPADGPAAAASGTGRRRAQAGHGTDPLPGPGMPVGGPPGASRDPVLGWGVIGAQRAQGTGGYGGAGRGPTGYVKGEASFTPGATPAGAGRTKLPEPRREAGGTSGGSHRAGSSGVVRTVTGVAAAVVTAVLAVAVAGQVEDGQESRAQARAADTDGRQGAGAASRSDSRPTPNGGAQLPATYDQQMARKYPLDPAAKGTGDFATMGGHDSAPGKGEVLRYRVDVERGLPLDGTLFATAVHRTLNDDRSWGHGGTRTFERISSGTPDFVITLASPRTTAAWCAKSGLDTTEDNVSCDSAATDRVMINAYRWAQGSQTYGDQMHAYRQMLINHEVGHRLGHDHETCEKQGGLAPVMMQQTKFLTTDGRTCRANPWPYPAS